MKKQRKKTATKRAKTSEKPLPRSAADRVGRPAVRHSNSRGTEALSRAYARPRTGGLANVPKANVGTTIQDFIDFDDARVVTATSWDGALFDVVHVR